MSTILHILQHALGRDAYGRRKSGLTEDYRNHYCTSPGCEGWTQCEEAVAAGLMVKHPPCVVSGGDWIFTVTEAGKRYVAEHSPSPPKLTRSQQRYRRWLDVADALGCSFGEWLKLEQR